MNLTKTKVDALVALLKARFEQHASRHNDLVWAQVQARLSAHPEKLPSLHAMEASGGEPDVIGLDPSSGHVIFCDCSAESPQRPQKPLL